MKKILLILALTLTACAPTAAPATSAGPSVEEIVAATMQALTAAAPPTATTAAPVDGMAVSYQNFSFVLPNGLATSALAGTVPAVNETEGPMVNAPAHVKFELDYYALYNTFHDAQVLIYPAQEYAAVNEGAAANIARLQAIINGTAAASADNLPHITTFNAAQAFAAQIQPIKFANGSGVRYLTEYAQYVVTANNTDLFYCFQGLTDDGKYYILAILPVSHPLLAFDEKPETVVPDGGVPFPGYENPDASAFDAYYDSVVNLLNQQAANSFMPMLTDLDKLIASITVTP